MEGPESTLKERTKEQGLDALLQIFVAVCNSSDAELPVTLNVHGCYVSGYIVSPKKFFNGIADMLRQTTDAGTKGFADSVFGQLGQACLADNSPISEPNDHPTIIHLKNAKFFSPVGRPSIPTHGVWWRGRLSSVDGFFWGVIDIK